MIIEYNRTLIISCNFYATPQWNTHEIIARCSAHSWTLQTAYDRSNVGHVHKHLAARNSNSHQGYELEFGCEFMPFLLSYILRKKHISEVESERHIIALCSCSQRLLRVFSENPILTCHSELNCPPGTKRGLTILFLECEEVFACGTPSPIEIGIVGTPHNQPHSILKWEIFLQ